MNSSNRSTENSTIIDITNKNSSRRSTYDENIIKKPENIHVNDRMLLKKVIHPIFQKCIEYTNDPYWRTKLFMAARGKFIKGFTYSHKHIKTRKKPIKSVYISNDPSIVINDFINFFHKFSYYSEMDYKYNEINNTMSENKGAISFTTNYIKSYINCYVDRLTEENNLSEKARKSLKETLLIGINLGIIKKTDITFEENIIVDVDCIIYLEEEDIFTIDESFWNNNIKIKDINLLDGPLNNNISNMDYTKKAEYIPKYKKIISNMSNKSSKANFSDNFSSNMSNTFPSSMSNSISLF